MLMVLKKTRILVKMLPKLKYYLNNDNLIEIYHSLIECHLRYRCGISVRNHGNSTIVQSMQKIICNKFTSYIQRKQQQ